jgi:hypothetical protein
MMALSFADIQGKKTFQNRVSITTQRFSRLLCLVLNFGVTANLKALVMPIIIKSIFDDNF